MTFKSVIVFVVLAYANAGLIGQISAPENHYSPAASVSRTYFQSNDVPVAVGHTAPVATYATSPIGVNGVHFGTTGQSILRSFGGNQAVSHYSKAVDSAFSSVRNYDSRITNDATYAAPIVAKTYAAPVTSYSSPVINYSAAPIPTYAHATPVTTYSHAAPVATYSHAAPVATYSHAAPVATYSHATPIAAYSAPLVSKNYAAPVVARAGVAYSPAAAVSHASFAGLGAHYEW